MLCMVCRTVYYALLCMVRVLCCVLCTMLCCVCYVALCTMLCCVCYVALRTMLCCYGMSRCVLCCVLCTVLCCVRYVALRTMLCCVRYVALHTMLCCVCYVALCRGISLLGTCNPQHQYWVSNTHTDCCHYNLQHQAWVSNSLTRALTATTKPKACHYNNTVNQAVCSPVLS